MQTTFAFKNELSTGSNNTLLEMNNVCGNSTVCVGTVRTTC